MVTQSPNAPHLYLGGGVTPGQGQENRAYYNGKLKSYFEWEYIDTEKTEMKVRLYDGYDIINGVWRGTNKQGYEYHFYKNDDDSWSPGI